VKPVFSTLVGSAIPIIYAFYSIVLHTSPLAAIGV
jgi:hypothetical protein